MSCVCVCVCVCVCCVCVRVVPMSINMQIDLVGILRCKWECLIGQTVHSFSSTHVHKQCKPSQATRGGGQFLLFGTFKKTNANSHFYLNELVLTRIFGRADFQKRNLKRLHIILTQERKREKLKAACIILACICSQLSIKK